MFDKMNSEHPWRKIIASVMLAVTAGAVARCKERISIHFVNRSCIFRSLFSIVAKGRRGLKLLVAKVDSRRWRGERVMFVRLYTRGNFGIVRIGLSRGTFLANNNCLRCVWFWLFLCDLQLRHRDSIAGFRLDYPGHTFSSAELL